MKYKYGKESDSCVHCARPSICLSFRILHHNSLLTLQMSVFSFDISKKQNLARMKLV
ncbi:hypothetical protein C0J52_02298 [Blattella germanica]|nr:hypothetical protein C0J52_02298 [Blattella germanica]